MLTMPVVVQWQVPVAQRVLRTVAVQQLQFIDKSPTVQSVRRTVELRLTNQVLRHDTKPSFFFGREDGLYFSSRHKRKPLF